MSAEGSKKAILAALAANAGIATAKFVGFFITGSSSMLAEGVHSVADTSNQALLLRGQAYASRRADELHQFGYGRARYFYAFVVALIIFSLGALFALYEGFEKIREPHELSSPMVAVAILVVAIGLESYSFYTAMTESVKIKGGVSWWQFIRTSRTPELPVVLLEDLGALVGLALALGGVGMTVITGDPVWDAIGTLAIGVLLAIIAVILIIEMKSLLIGEGLTIADQNAVRAALESEPRIDRVIHLRSQYLGPDEVLIAAKVAVGALETARDVASAIDAAEIAVRKVQPAAQRIYIEPDIDRGA